MSLHVTEIILYVLSILNTKIPIKQFILTFYTP
jgi:hypothetical protein